MLPENPLYRRRISAEIPGFLKNTGFVGLEFSGNIALLRTRPGYAAGISTDIDEHNLESVAGTLAGDDSIIVVIREGYDRQQVIDDLAHVLPAVKSVSL